MRKEQNFPTSSAGILILLLSKFSISSIGILPSLNIVKRKIACLISSVVKIVFSSSAVSKVMLLKMV